MGVGDEENLVSVIIPTLNRPETLVAAVESVLTQDYPFTEIIVVNDGGADPTPALQSVFGRCVHPKQSLIINRHERGGLSAARNSGLASASGEYFAYLDDDDLFADGHLSKLVGALKNSQADIVYSDFEKIELDQDGKLLLASSQRCPEFDYERLMLENYIPVNALVHRRRCVELCGDFDEWLTGLEDWELWFRFAQRFVFEHVPGVSCKVFSRGSRDNIGGRHRYGYSWPALNLLYKCKQVMRHRPDLVAVYEDRTRAAIEHIKQVIYLLWQERKESLEPIFGFHHPKKVYARLLELQDHYPERVAGFLQLRGMLKAHMGEFREAREELKASLALDSQQEDAKQLLAILENAKEIS